MRWITAQIKWIMIVAGAPVGVDSVMICLFAIYLFGSTNDSTSA